MKTLLKYFVQGLIYVAPVFVTVYVIYKAFVLIDNLIPINIPGLGLLIVLVFITVIGVVAKHLISDSIIALFERIMKKAPLINVIYTAVKDLTQAFVGKKKSFSKPVLVKFAADSEVRRLGFVTNTNFQNLSEDQSLITVYIPHSYNISGNMFLVPASYVQVLDANASEIMKYAVSGGVTDLGEVSILRENQSTDE